MPTGKPATVESYIAGFPPDIALILQRLRETILKAAPGATEAIKYGMPGFFIGKRHVIYLGAWKHHAGIYPVYPQSPALEAELASLRSGKDTVKLPYAGTVPYALVARIVKARIRDLKAKPA